MSKPKFTPGPWRVGEFTRTSVEGGVPCQEIGAGPEDDGRCVALAFNYNARLIAAAPELLEALKEMVERLGPDADENPWSPQIEMLNAAIAKAESREVPEPACMEES